MPSSPSGRSATCCWASRRSTPLYQTVTTVSTVGFREVEPLDAVGKVFTIVLILLGVGTALFTLGALVEALVEGQLRDVLGRRRMDRRIADEDGPRDRVRLGPGGAGHRRLRRRRRHATSWWSTATPNGSVAIELRVASSATPPTTRCSVAAGIERARALVAALASDADNLFLTLTGRSLRPDLFIVARARYDATEQKLLRAGADRVVNPQRIGGPAHGRLRARQPHVAEFLDVVMHDGSLEFRLEEVAVPAGSPLGGRTLREAHLRDRTGALVLAIRGTGRHASPPTPAPETVIEPGDVLIAIGTAEQLAALAAVVRP